MARPRKTDQLFQKRDLPPEDAIEILNRHITALSEHFDNVIILASRQDRDQATMGYVQKSGNVYALKAQMDEYSCVILNPPEEPEPEGED